MSCEEAQAMLLAGDGSPALDGHLAGCAACRSASAELAHLRRLLADQTMWETPSTGLEDRVVAAVAEAARPPRRAVAPRRMLVASAATLVAVAATVVGFWVGTRPDWQVDLEAMGSAARASAVVDGWRSETGTRMRFDIRGLPPAGADSYYEVWLTAPDGRHVSAGTFRGDGVVDTWAGVDRADFPRIWITLEPADDDLGPSSVVVFDTTT
jgi:hypothetical protein